MRKDTLEARDPRGFDHVETWVFDLDNTLYPSATNLFELIDHRMGEFVAELLSVPYEHGRYLQKAYYRQFGTTLAGLMACHGVEPERFLDYVHDIDYGRLKPDLDLAREIARLPGRKLVFTNGTHAHADAVLERLELAHLIDGKFDIADADYIPKPKPEAFDRFVKAHEVRPGTAAMFEDMPHNLEEAHRLGMTTVLVVSDYIDHPAQRKVRSAADRPGHIDHVTRDLAGFLFEAVARPA